MCSQKGQLRSPLTVERVETEDLDGVFQAVSPGGLTSRLMPMVVGKVP